MCYCVLQTTADCSGIIVLCEKQNPQLNITAANKNAHELCKGCLVQNTQNTMYSVRPFIRISPNGTPTCENSMSMMMIDDVTDNILDM